MTTTKIPPTDAAAGATPAVIKAPPTGAEFLKSLQDGREIYFDGARVDDVTTHPAFATSARSYARMYDTLHDPLKQDLLTFVTERGTRSHKFYKLPETKQDLFEGRDAIAEWARLSFGSLSRGPDYKAALVGALAADADFYGDYAPNVRRWYEKVTDDVMFVNLSLLNPAGDRSKRPSEQRDTYMHVVKEREDGIVVRGARMVSTGAAFSQVTYVSQYFPAGGLGGDEEDFALGFFLPFNAPGVKFIGRYSYEHLAKKIGSPFDYPLSSRFDESDMSIVLDDVFVPWEDVTAYRNPDVVNGLFSRGFAQRFTFHAAVRTAVKMDFICGLLLKAVEMSGMLGFRGVQAQVGELIGMRHNLWALNGAMAADAHPGPAATCCPTPTTGCSGASCTATPSPRPAPCSTTCSPARSSRSRRRRRTSRTPRSASTSTASGRPAPRPPRSGSSCCASSGTCSRPSSAVARRSTSAPSPAATRPTASRHGAPRSTWASTTSSRRWSTSA